jgi:hypothetical protein
MLDASACADPHGAPLRRTGCAVQLRVALDAWSRECPMLTVALRTRVEAQLLPAAGPPPRPQQHRICSPVLGLKHSIEWALAAPAAGATRFCFACLDSNVARQISPSAFQLHPRLPSD